MKKKQDYIKFLLPLVAVVVIIESVVLLMKVDGRKPLSSATDELVMIEVTGTEEEPQVALSFATETRKMEVGEKYLVEVNAIGLAPAVAGQAAVALDSAELYVTYDPKALGISELSFSDKLPEPIFSRVSEKKELVAVTYLVMEEGGFELGEGEAVSFLKFEVEPLAAGDYVLDFATGNAGEESVTMFVESKTGRVLPFSVSSLNIEVE